MARTTDRSGAVEALPGALDAVFSSEDIDYCVEAFELRWPIMPAIFCWSPTAR